MTNLMEQARKGDPKAIAALMNRSTEPKGISVKASRDGDCLQVLLEGESVPTRDATLSFVRQGMENLNIASIAIVRVFGRQIGQDTPVWQDEIVLYNAPMTAAPMAAEDDSFEDEDLLPDDDLAEDDYAAPNSLEDGAYFDEDDYSDSTPSDVPHLPNESITDFVDDEPDLDDAAIDDDSLSTDDVTDTEPKSEKQSSASLLVLSVLALLLGGYYIYSQKPEVLAGLPVIGELVAGSSNGEATAPAEGDAIATEQTEQAAPGTTPSTVPETAPEETSETAPAGAPEPTDAAPAAPSAAPNPTTIAEDPFRLAVTAATQAAEQTQSAQTAAEWAAIVTLWETAITQMQAVPSDSPNYSVAQDRLGSYPANLDYARLRAGQ